jgi:hypothetical protein
MQPELLYYFLSFSAFVLMLRLLVVPSWKLGLAAGALLGLAHLTKASVLPALLLFAVIVFAKTVYELLQRRRGDAASNALALASALLAFLVVVFPYIRESKQVYGQYFYNVNSTFYIWYD